MRSAFAHTGAAVWRCRRCDKENPRERSHPGRSPERLGVMLREQAWTPWSRHEDDERRLAHSVQRSDEAAAQALGLPIVAFRLWRLARGLPTSGRSVSERGHPLSDAEELRRLAAYQSEPTDELAAQSLGLTLRAFRSWRAQRRLPNRRAMPLPIQSMFTGASA